MARKIMNWKTKGMNRDLSVSAFNPEFAFENMNLRLSTNNNNTMLSWVTEKGTSPINIMHLGRGASLVPSINGICIGTAVLNDYLILFITLSGVKDNPDFIYRLSYTNRNKDILSLEKLYSGDLGFDVNYPIETLVSYESDYILKVYWTDGKNQPRMINISPDNDDKIRYYTPTSFDFVPTLELNEVIKVKKTIGGGGAFAPGVIQYAFTYYNKHGQESNVFYVTPLYYISFLDRGAAPDEKVDNTFNISIEGIDDNFDFLRIYSIQRTSIDNTPLVKRIQDIEISTLNNKKASYIDTGTSGDTVPPMDLFYKGGHNVTVGTLELKDNTLFLGDITIKNEKLLELTANEKALITLDNATRKFYPTVVSSVDYLYLNQLTSYDEDGNSVPVAGFKNKDIYRCGILFQDAFGRWSNPIYLDDFKITNNFSSENTKVDTEKPESTILENQDSRPDPEPLPDPEPIQYGSDDEGGSVTCTVTIINNAIDGEVTIGKNIGILLYGTPSNESSPRLIKVIGTCSGASYSIENGRLRTYTVTFLRSASLNPLKYRNIQFASSEEYDEDYNSNCGCLLTDGTYRACKAIDNTSVFDNNGLYTLIINPRTMGNITWAKLKDPSKSRTSSRANSRGNNGDISDSNSPVIEVPVIKCTIKEALATKLKEEYGYVKARAVIVYPRILDRVTVCQGVVTPTVYTMNHRGTSKSKHITNDLYALSSWFFRPMHTDTEIYGDVNYPPTSIVYLDREGDPSKIKTVEIQGHFNEENLFKTDWYTLTFHSPDIEFDDNLANFYYNDENLTYVWTANALFKRTFSDIDIQTSTPTISSKGAGFIKKSFTGNYAKGIISGLFYEDLYVDDLYDDNFGPFIADAELDDETTTYHTSRDVASKWLVYLWNKKGSLNNDITRPADKGIQSAMLLKKIISNLRYADTLLLKDEKPVGYYYTHLFYSRDLDILRLNGIKEDYPDIYYGNVDTLLIPDDTDGLYFAFGYLYSTPDFNSVVDWKTFYNPKETYERDGDDIGSHGLWLWNSVKKFWRFDVTYWQAGDKYTELVLKKEGVRMLYKSTPHLVIKSEDNFLPSSYYPTDYSNYKNCYLPIYELRRTVNNETIFGGKSTDALRENVWIPCGEPVSLEPKTPLGPLGTSMIGDKCVELYYEWGDTYYQRWDCLKTYAGTPEDINQVIEIGSFMMETHVNIDGRYDKNRGLASNLYMSPINFNLINHVYSQLNNFYTYSIPDKDAKYELHYPNLITWTLTKNSGAEVDNWTNVSMGGNLELDGDKGSVKKLIKFNNQLLCFQDKGLSLILYNDNVMVATDAGVPVELANSNKVLGKKYISDTIGCSNKWTIVSTPMGIYFMDDYDRSILLFGERLDNLSVSKGMNSWIKTNSKSPESKWNPLEFGNFRAVYDKLNQDVLFIDNNIALAFSEKIGAFTSFYNYENSPYLSNLSDTGIWIKNSYDEVLSTYKVNLWKHNGGNYCNFFNQVKPYWMTLIGNPEPMADKIFTNLEFRANVDTDGIESFNKFIPLLPFNYLETWNEYQHGIMSLDNKFGHSYMTHYNGNSEALKRKFRIWRCDIPTDNAPLYKDDGMNIYRKQVHPVSRMRNTWLYLKLQREPLSSDYNIQRTEIHDIQMSYFT